MEVSEHCSSFDHTEPEVSGCRITAVEYAAAAVVVGNIVDFVRAYFWLAICCFCLYSWMGLYENLRKLKPLFNINIDTDN